MVKSYGYESFPRIIPLSTSENLQDAFLRKLVTERTPVAIYLVNGIRLHGWIADFDRFGVLLKGASLQLVYKQSISTILLQDAAHHAIPPPPTAAEPHADGDASPGPAASRPEPRDAEPTTTRIVLTPRKRPGTS